MGNTPSGSANEGGRSRPPVPATPATPAAPAAWDDDDCSMGSSRFGDDDLEIAEAPAPSPSHLCYVCCVARKNAVIMECGHGGMCMECATHSP